MARFKTNKEYAIKITHPEFGVYYYSHYNYVASTYSYYSNNNSNSKFNYIFVQDLSKVLTWKSTGFTEKQIVEINTRLHNNSGQILLSLGTEVNQDIKDRAIISKKKYYFEVKAVTSREIAKTAQDDLSRLNVSLLEDCKKITKLIKKNRHVEKDFQKEFMKIFKQFDTDINLCRKSYNFLDNSQNVKVFIEMVDASYNFRLLKLRTLNKLQEE
jgi:hypothetical protein